MFSLTTLRRAARSRASRLVLTAGLLGATALVVAPAFAQDHNHDDPHGSAHKPPPTHPTGPAGHEPATHGEGHEAGHGEGHGPGEINWVYGLIGESKDGEKSLLFRPKGMPVPFLANLINFGIVVGVLVRFGSKPIASSLEDRRESLSKDIENAAQAKAEAKARFDEQKGLLDGIDEEKARIEADYREQGKLEKERIVREAKERRERMKRDAQFLLEQETKALRQVALNDTVTEATASAEQLLKQQLTAQDQERLASDFLRELGGFGAGGAYGDKRGAA
jgi:F-type H+-transporting ATPase subunit b